MTGATYRDVRFDLSMFDLYGKVALVEWWPAIQTTKTDRSL